MADLEVLGKDMTGGIDEQDPPVCVCGATCVCGECSGRNFRVVLLRDPRSKTLKIHPCRYWCYHELLSAKEATTSTEQKREE